jgi:3-oxoacyl-[acyl-carrier-protein] synthase II
MSAAVVALPAPRALPEVAPLAVTASGVVSAAGFGMDALAEALAGVRQPHTEPTDPDGADHPPRALRTVAPFDRAALLGRKGTRNLDRLTQLGLLGADQAIAALPGGLAGVELDRTGAVVGTTTGSITTATDVGRETLVNEKPYMVNPATFPNTVMNTCSGQIAIRHGLLGVNAAVSGGPLTWLYAVRYARTALTSGRADRLLVGAVEEVTARTAWAWHLTGLLTPDAPLGEGAAFFVMERTGEGTAPAAELLGCEVGYYGGAGPGLPGGLRRCIAAALQRSGLTPSDVDVVVPGAGGHVRLGMIERRATESELGALPETLDVVPALGEAYSASGALQLAALLATSAGTGRIGLVTAMGEDGGAGALVVRC